MTGNSSQTTDDAYAASGVNIDAGQEAVRLISPLARGTFTSRVLSEVGGFGGLFRLDGYREPVLVASADGVGTKLRIAITMDSFASVGADMVNHSVNDIWVQGADPLFFLDYLAAGRLDPQKAAEIVRGMADACKDAGCALLGGETAEMPGTYAPGDYDVAGFIVGAAERWNLLDGSAVRAGDLLVGFPSSGLHTNGFSLVRRVFDLDDHPERLNTRHDELGQTLGEALLAIHTPYYRPLKPIQKKLRAMAHITGGGVIDNLPRVIPTDFQAIVRRDAWEVPPLFRLIQREGNVDEAEMYRVFNMGVGFIAVVRPADAEAVAAAMSGAVVVGEVVERGDGEDPLQLI